jgi:hypothetical protein
MEQYPTGFTPDAQSHPDGFTPDPTQPSTADKIAKIKAGLATQPQYGDTTPSLVGGFMSEVPKQASQFGSDLVTTLKAIREANNQIGQQTPSGRPENYDPYGILGGAVVGPEMKGMSYLEKMAEGPIPKLASSLVDTAAQASKRMKSSVLDAASALAERIAGTSEAATKLKAGEAVQTSLGTKIEDLKAAQKQAYDAVAQAESNSLQKVKTGTQEVPDIQGVTTVGMKTVPVMTEMPAPVSLKEVKRAVQPILDDIEKELPISQRDTSPGYTVLKNVVSGPDYMPLSAAEKTLSRIKAIGRQEVLPQIKDRAAGIASAVVPQLQTAIDTKAAEIGALDHLNIGRALTKEKYATGELLNSMSDEPVRLVDYLTNAGDKSIGQLREVAASIPGELPQIGQAYLKGILQKASANGKFDPASAMRAYNGLGAESKKLLFGDNTKNLDELFSIVGQKLQGPSLTTQQLGSSIGAAGGGILGHQLGGTLGLGAGATAGAVTGGKIAGFVGNKLNIGGQMMLNADQTARVLGSQQGASVLKTALMLPLNDPHAQQLTRLLLVIANHANQSGKASPQGLAQ